uniref:Uncharacterized protein n=1 Tax=Panagrolaimus davidi TaxID=227884 RepID=A0A914QTF7_9BILA
MFGMKLKRNNYPNIQHEVLATEIKLLCLPVSQMYEELNTLVHDSLNKLCAAGFGFDMDRQIVTVLKGARQFVKDPATDATTVYFAFGAEYPHMITDDPEIMDKASIPLLYVIALQPRFPEASRRKACAIMRRKLVRVLGYYKAADRAKMPFPVNIVEHAYCRDPKYFYDPSAIKTDSGSDGKKKQIADGKRKKKSSKKH